MEKEKIMEFLEGSKEKALEEVLMGLGEVLFGDDFRNRFDMYCNRKKELRLNDVSASICKALNGRGVPPYVGQKIHSQILCELFPKEEFEGNEEEKEKAEKAEKAETETMTLEDTVDDMLSSDYKDRFRAEYNQLSIRINSLEKVLKNYKLSDGYSPKTYLREQLDAMKIYKGWLDNRRMVEEINVFKEEE